MPKLTFTATPSSLLSSQSASLNWNAVDADNCTASGAWSGSKATSGSQSTGALTATSTYTLSCTGAGGSTAGSTTMTVTTGTPGTLSFRRTVIDSGSVNNPWMKSISDLNGDGLPDLIVAGASGPIVWYQAPAWTRYVISNSANSESGSAVSDIDGDGDGDGDGDVDVVVGTTWYENPGSSSVTNTWTAHAFPDGSAGTHDIVITDVNGDGKQDIVMRGENQSTVWVFLQVSPTSWTEFTMDPRIGRNGLDVVDINGDGLPDIVVGRVWMQNPGGNVATATWPKHSFTSWNDYAAVKVVDMDGDGRPDIVLSVSEGVGKLSWFKAPADPTTGPWAENIIDTGLDHVHMLRCGGRQ